MANVTIKRILRVNLFKTILFQIEKLIYKNGSGKVLFYGNSYYSYHKSATVVVNQGILHFNEASMSKEPFQGLLNLHNNASLVVNKSFYIKSGAHVIVAKNAKLLLGSGFINRNVSIRCFEQIEIGYDVAISESVTIWDSDVHQILIPGKIVEKTKPIKIGNNVWVGANVTILKGTVIGDNSVIAAGALVSGIIPPNCLAAGVPARVIRENINWNK